MAVKSHKTSHTLLACLARLKLTLTMESDARIGPGKAALLESMAKSGSICAAARSNGNGLQAGLRLIALGTTPEHVTFGRITSNDGDAGS